MCLSNRSPYDCGPDPRWRSSGPTPDVWEELRAVRKERDHLAGIVRDLRVWMQDLPFSALAMRVLLWLDQRAGQKERPHTEGTPLVVTCDGCGRTLHGMPTMGRCPCGGGWQLKQQDR